MAELILVDLASKTGKSFSPNVWKTRLVLNYKNIPYKTRWVTFSNLQQILKESGTPPNPQPNFAGSLWTVPHITFPSGEQMMDSLKIAETLEARYPSPSLRMDSAIQAEAQELVLSIFRPLLPAFIVNLRTHAIVAEDIPFIETRAAQFNVELGGTEVEIAERDEKAWQNAQPALEAFGIFLNKYKKDDGPFVLGSEISYADFVSLGVVKSFLALGGEKDRFFQSVKGLRELYGACEGWMAKDD